MSVFLGGGPSTLARGDVPNLHGLVPARRGDPLAIRTEGDVHDVHLLIVPSQRADFLPGCRVPDLEGSSPVPTGRGVRLPVRAERHAAAFERSGFRIAPCI